MAHLARMTEKMDALTTRMDAIEVRSRPPAPILPNPPSETPTPQITTLQATQPATQEEDKRWRPEEVGILDDTGIYSHVQTA